MPNDFRPAQIDFSPLANLPGQYASGQKWRQEQDFRQAFAGGIPRGPDGEADIGAMVNIIAKFDPLAAAKLASDHATTGSDQYGLNPIYGTDEQGNPVLMQPKKSGGVSQVQMPPGVTPSTGFDKIDLGTQWGILDKRSGAITGYMPKDVAGEAAQKKSGELTGQAQADLPKAEAAAARIIAQLEDVENDPQLGNVTGWQGYLPTFNPKNVTIESKIKQLEGGFFLQAFESLKGGGQITEVEGQKATSALARLQELRQDDVGYKAALADAKKEVMALLELARTRAGGGKSGSPQPQQGGGAQPAPDKIELLRQHAQDPRAIQAFEKFYGPGSAQQFLGQ